MHSVAWVQTNRTTASSLMPSTCLASDKFSYRKGHNDLEVRGLEPGSQINHMRADYPRLHSIGRNYCFACFSVAVNRRVVSSSLPEEPAMNSDIDTMSGFFFFAFLDAQIAKTGWHTLKLSYF